MATNYCKDANCIGAWLLNEGSGLTVEDYSPNTNTLSFKGAGEPVWNTTDVPFANTGAAPNSVQFDGLDDYLTITHNSTLNFGDVVTFTALLKLNDITPQFNVFFSKSTNSLILAVNANQILVIKHGVGVISTSTFTFTDTNFHRVVVTKNGATTKIYVDGADVTGVITNQTLANNSEIMCVGDDVNGTTHAPHTTDAFNGYMADVGLFSRALTSTEATEIYNFGLAGGNSSSSSSSSCKSSSSSCSSCRSSSSSSCSSCSSSSSSSCKSSSSSCSSCSSSCSSSSRSSSSSSCCSSSSCSSKSSSSCSSSSCRSSSSSSSISSSCSSSSSCRSSSSSNSSSSCSSSSSQSSSCSSSCRSSSSSSRSSSSSSSSVSSSSCSSCSSSSNSSSSCSSSSSQSFKVWTPRDENMTTFAEVTDAPDVEWKDRMNDTKAEDA